MALEKAEATGIFGTSITFEWLERKLQEALDTSVKFGPNVSTEQFAVGQGFMSVMVRMKPDWQGETTDKLPSRLVVKIPTSVTMNQVSKQTNWEEKMKDADATINLEEQIKAFDDVIIVAHNFEATFYNIVNRNQLKLKVPKCYHVQHFKPNGESGLLIMEDLGDVAAIKPIYEGLSVESVKAILESIADIHAFSLQNDQWISDMTTLAEFQKYSGGENFPKTMIGSMEMLKKDHAETFDPLIDRLIDSCRKEFGLEYLDTIHEKLGLPRLLTHGDLWMSNMMWRKAENGKGTTDELVAIVDWQLVHAGCVGEDFVRLLCSSVEPHIRREHLEEFIEHYHMTLKAKLGKEPPFTVAQIIDAYKRLFRHGVVLVLPCFRGFLHPELGMLGEEHVEQRRRDILNRAKCFLEDLYAYEDELAKGST